MCGYIIGVDAGGTKTNARLYSRSGRELYCADSGPGNILSDRDLAFRSIREAVAACLGNVPEQGEAYIMVGAAGITAGTNRWALLEFLCGEFPGCVINAESDGLLAVYGKLRGRDGILVVSGTGSIAYGKLGGKSERAGGWGQILGDEGSAYHIAVNALREVTRAYDENREYGACSLAILRELGTDVFGLAAFAASHTKSEVAALSRIVAEQAANGDKQAEEILRGAGRQLAGLAKKIYLKTGFTAVAAVAVGGSVLENDKIARPAFEQSLEPTKFFILGDTPPAAMGAYYYYNSMEAEK
ncbi:MAG: hypothetical protein FWH02_03665 [Oscillospiraceae bacterium]|nr:hypothetical protein [Oscillospiraceae bacterium]